MPPMSCQRDSDGNKSNVNGFPKVIIYKLRPDAWTRVLYVYNIFINNAVYEVRRPYTYSAKIACERTTCFVNPYGYKSKFRFKETINNDSILALSILILVIFN